jgi:hypothetical protein
VRTMTLTVFDDGKAILSVDADLTMREMDGLREAYRRWADSEEAAAVLIMTGTVVRLHEKAPGELVMA